MSAPQISLTKGTTPRPGGDTHRTRMRRERSGRPAVAKSFLVDLTDVDLSSRQAVLAAVGGGRGRKPAPDLARPRRTEKPSGRRAFKERSISSIRVMPRSRASPRSRPLQELPERPTWSSSRRRRNRCPALSLRPAKRVRGRDHHHRRARPRSRLARRRAARKPRARPACGWSAPIASACWRRAPSSTPASPRACRRAGDLALISQSGAIAAGLVEWAAAHGIGFSAVVSLGDKIDVDFGDLLDYFALDRATRAILLYVESINNARKFMSAARAAARIKPVVVVKSGRHAQGAKAAQTHTGALAGVGCGLRCRVPPRRPAARARSRRTVRRGGDARAACSRFRASGWRSSPMAAASACWPSTGSSISAARSPAFRRRRCRSSMRRCRRSGRAPTRSTSPATPMRRATPPRSRRCSTTRTTTPSWS